MPDRQDSPVSKERPVSGRDWDHAVHADTNIRIENIK